MRVFFLLTAVALAPAAAAQSLSVDDIRAQISAERDAPNPYAELLADPDPYVARRAMEIILDSGDAELRRLALEFGVNSPQADVRHRALGAWLESSPRIEFVIESAGAPPDIFAQTTSRLYGTAPNARGEAIWIVQLGSFSADRECITRRDGGHCLFRHTPNGTWIFKNGVWQEVGLNDAGELVANVTTRANNTPAAQVRFRAPVP